MTNYASELKTLESDTDEVSIKEFFEPTRYTIVTTTKRAESFKIVKSGGKFNFFKIIYESGKSIPQLEGNFTSHTEALTTLLRYIESRKKSKNAVYNERWGDKPIPELKKKKRPGFGYKRKKVVDAFSSTDDQNSD